MFILSPIVFTIRPGVEAQLMLANRVLVQLQLGNATGNQPR